MGNIQMQSIKLRNHRSHRCSSILPCRHQPCREFPALRFIVPVVIPFVAGSAPSGEKWKHPLIHLHISHLGRIRD